MVRPPFGELSSARDSTRGCVAASALPATHPCRCLHVVSRKYERGLQTTCSMRLRAANRGLHARIVGWTLTSACVLAVWRRSG